VPIALSHKCNTRCIVSSGWMVDNPMETT
jgi:hypothetical protein